MLSGYHLFSLFLNSGCDYEMSFFKIGVTGLHLYSRLGYLCGFAKMTSGSSSLQNVDFGHRCGTRGALPTVVARLDGALIMQFCIN